MPTDPYWNKFFYNLSNKIVNEHELAINNKLQQQLDRQQWLKALNARM